MDTYDDILGRTRASLDLLHLPLPVNNSHLDFDEKPLRRQVLKSVCQVKGVPLALTFVPYNNIQVFRVLRGILLRLPRSKQHRVELSRGPGFYHFSSTYLLNILYHLLHEK